jgi:hypothetical protein
MYVDTGIYSTLFAGWNHSIASRSSSWCPANRAISRATKKLHTCAIFGVPFFKNMQERQ